MRKVVNCFLFVLACFSLSALADQGIRANADNTATVYFSDQGWTGRWNFICIDDGCVSGDKVGSEWQRTVSGLVVGQAYKLELKIQDDASGQYISDPVTVVFDGGAVTPTPTPVVATPTPTPVVATPTPTPVVATPTPTPVVATPTPTPVVVPPASGGDFCLVYDSNSSARVTHVDKPFRANYHFLCLNGQCLNADLVDGVWQTVFNNLSVGTSYQIKTQIDDTNGECGIEANVIFQEGESCVVSTCLPPDEEAPSIPSNLQGEGKNGRAVSLSWSASTDDRAVSRYTVYRNNVEVGSSAETRFNDAGLTAETAYTYTVDACDAANNCSVQSAAITVNTGVFVPDVNPPSVPTGLSGEGVSSEEVLLTWNASSDAEGVVVEYRVYQDGQEIATTAETSYTVGGMDEGEEHTYQVAACDDSGNCSGPSAAQTFMSKPPSFAHLNWTHNSHNSNESDPRGGDPMRPHNENSVAPEAYTDGPEFLPTPFNGSEPTTWGFAFDIEIDTVSWRFGPGFNDGFFSGYADLEMYCSPDDNITFLKTSIPLSGGSAGSGSATIPAECVAQGAYTYFFRYKHPLPLTGDPASAWIYTAGFTTESRVDPFNYPSFVDGSANWTRYRHPVSNDGITAALLDNPINGMRIRQMDRYTIWIEDNPGNVQVNFEVTNPDDTFVRNDTIRNSAGVQNGQQQFFFQQNPGFDNAFSYGQVVQFEFTVSAAGGVSAQTYNDFSYYTIGQGFGAYGDPRLNSAGKAGTTMWLSDSGVYGNIEHNAVFTQPFTTINKEQQVDDFIVGHHLFHGVDPLKKDSHLFDDPDVRIGKESCGRCHFRDGRGSEVIQTVRGPRLPPPTYGVKLLEVIEGREVGFRWDGQVDTVAQQVINALEEDHDVNPKFVPEPVINLITAYTEMLTVPNRNPGAYDDPSVVRGDALFNEIGCSSCHTPVQKTRTDAEPHLRNLTIRPYTDMKVWDLGEGSFRTAPLWGLGHNLSLLDRNGRDVLFMHDGASTSVEHAISRHGGSAHDVLDNYEALGSGDKAAIVNFVKTL